MSLNETHLTGAWLSTAAPAVTYRIEERAHRITHDGPGMFVRRNELWRLECAQDGTVRDERFVAANDALMMYEPFLPPAADPRGYDRTRRPNGYDSDVRVRHADRPGEMEP